MSDEIKPDVQITSDVEEPKTEIQEVIEPAVNYAEKTLAELSGLFEKLMEDVDKVRKSKEAEAIKSAFYKKLSKEKAEAGLSPVVAEPESEENTEEQAAEEPVQEQAEKLNPFEAIEAGFKSLYNSYRKERAEYTRQVEAEKSENLVKKQAVIE